MVEKRMQRRSAKRGNIQLKIRDSDGGGRPKQKKKNDFLLRRRRGGARGESRPKERDEVSETEPLF